jgi:very-short-patch-repair endonuclease
LQIHGIPLQEHKLSLPANPKLKMRARALRKARNLPEVLFWLQVKNKQFHCLDFDRQKVIGNFIIDFYCTRLGLVVEIDGGIHETQEAYDDQRQKWLENQGCKVLRFSSLLVKNHIGQVLEEMEEFILHHYSLYK